MCGRKHILAPLVYLRTKCSQFSRFSSHSLIVNLFIHSQLFQIHNSITSSAQTAVAVILRDVFSHCFNTSPWWESSSWTLSVIWVLTPDVVHVPALTAFQRHHGQGSVLWGPQHKPGTSAPAKGTNSLRYSSTTAHSAQTFTCGVYFESLASWTTAALQTLKITLLKPMLHPSAIKVHNYFTKVAEQAAFKSIMLSKICHHPLGNLNFQNPEKNNW